MRKWTALHYAAKEGDIEIVKLLIEVYQADL
jgi:ankyrin repeat protein